MNHKISCHCGHIRLQVEGHIKSALACNCSICQRKGSLLWFVPRANLQFLTAENRASTYTFCKHVIKHRFCPHCGMHPYGEGTGPSGRAMAAINIRCIEGIDLKTIPVTEYNGRDL